MKKLVLHLLPSPTHRKHRVERERARERMRERVSEREREKNEREGKNTASETEIENETKTETETEPGMQKCPCRSSGQHEDALGITALCGSGSSTK